MPQPAADEISLVVRSANRTVRAICSPPGSRSEPRRWRTLLILLITVFFAGSQSLGGSKSRMVEVRDESTTYVGKVVAKDANSCLLIDRYGVMSELPISRLKSFTVVSESFKAASTSAFRQKLLKEFPSDYEVEISAHYVVCGGKGRTEAYSSLFEEIYRQITSFYSVRGFHTSDPEVPLVAIVFATQDEFREYCGRDAMKWTDTLRGYYSPKSNRVALYDDPSLQNSVAAAPPRLVVGTASPPDDRDCDSLTPHGFSDDSAALLSSVAGETANTIIHEATHQVGYNIGIHSRLGTTPTWLIEGLATLLEAPGMRVRGKSADGAKLNSGRLDWFTREYESRRKAGDLARMVATEEMFNNETLDAYSSAWAFTYFMTENPARARKFIGYLKTVTERDPLRPYTAEERLSDFTAAFGDIARLEVELIRTIDRLESP